MKSPVLEILTSVKSLCLFLHMENQWIVVNQHLSISKPFLIILASPVHSPLDFMRPLTVEPLPATMIPVWFRFPFYSLYPKMIFFYCSFVFQMESSNTKCTLHITPVPKAPAASCGWKCLGETLPQVHAHDLEK